MHVRLVCVFLSASVGLGAGRRTRGSDGGKRALAAARAWQSLRPGVLTLLTVVETAASTRQGLRRAHRSRAGNNPQHDQGPAGQAGHRACSGWSSIRTVRFAGLENREHGECTVACSRNMI